MASVEARLLGKMVTDQGGCWLWTAATSKRGYGRIQIGRSQCRYAHRVSFETFVGPIPKGMHVLHSCDVPGCINPHHLFLGTNADNVADRDAKKRGKTPRLRGEQCPWAKISEDNASEIKRRISSGERQHVVADDFGISQSNVSMINARQRWA